MKTILSAVITCAVLFGLSAGATKYLTDQSAAATGETDENAGVAETGDVANESATEDGVVQGLPAQSMPVSFRPDAQVSVEAVLQMSDSIKRMEQELAKREEKVRRDEKRVKLMFDDLATEQDQIRAFSESLESKLELVTRTKEQLEETLAQLDQRKNEMEKLAKKAEVKPDAKAQELDQQVNEVKSWFSNLDAEQAAVYLREFANNGKISLAASLLQQMPDRQKAKILGAMNDPVLVEQLIDALTPSKP